jgi:AcrR family transcriptional regulator
MGSKRDVEAERRKQILDAAEQVFARRGFDQARMDDIVAEAGLSKGALYWYYKSKDAIIRALLDRIFAGDLRQAGELAEASGSASDRLRLFVGRVIEEYRRLERLVPVVYEFVALATRPGPVRDTLVGYFRRYREIVTQIIRQGIDAGEFEPCDADAAAVSLISMYEGIALFWFFSSDLVDWDRMAEPPIEIFLAGLRRMGG